MISDCLIIGGLAVLVFVLGVGLTTIVLWLADVWQRRARPRVVDLTPSLPIARIHGQRSGTVAGATVKALPTLSPRSPALAPSSPTVEHRAATAAPADRAKSASF